MDSIAGYLLLFYAIVGGVSLILWVLKKLFDTRVIAGYLLLFYAIVGGVSLILRVFKKLDTRVIAWYLLQFYAIVGGVWLILWVLKKLLFDTGNWEEEEENEGGGGSDGRCFTCGGLAAAVEYMAVKNKLMEINKELERQQQLIQQLKKESEVKRRRAIAAAACVICRDKKREISFGYGHTACEGCALNISICHVCREPIIIRRRLRL